ncbi:MAG: hypothetical protein IKH42_05860, partial [Lachnospiraceae bacterium]|nr:hypothetical protein [Lachnospiraceae bacterium]
LVKEIAVLKDKLENAGALNGALNTSDKEVQDGEVYDEQTAPDDTAAVRVQKEGVSIIIPSDRADTIKIETLDGGRFVLIPLNDEEEPDIKEL